MSDDSDGADEDYGWDDFGEDEAQTYIDLFSSRTFNSPRELFHACQREHGFDFAATCRRLELDDYGRIKLINFIRRSVKEGVHDFSAPLATGDFLLGDEYLKPVLENDALLYDLDPDGLAPDEDTDDVQVLKARIRDMEAQFAEFRALARETLEARVDEDTGVAKMPSQVDNDAPYFESYAYNDIHETMLKDTIRTDAYRDFIYNNKALFSGKVVLDVGCGTGVLSMFAARAGAAHVFAVDNSAVIDKARANVFENEMQDVITCIRGKIEQVELPVDKVDIIVSEWMGYALLFESMFDSVIFARDRYLKHGTGIMAPCQTTIMLAPARCDELVTEKYDFWSNVYGLRMNAMKEGLCSEAIVQHMETRSLLAAPQSILDMNLYRITVKELEFEAPFEFFVSASSPSPLVAFYVWFDTLFLARPLNHVEQNLEAAAASRLGSGIYFTTGPSNNPRKATHWRQTVLLLDPEKVKGYGKRLAAEARIHGRVRFAKNAQNSRELDITLRWCVEDSEENEQTFRLK